MNKIMYKWGAVVTLLLLSSQLTFAQGNTKDNSINALFTAENGTVVLQEYTIKNTDRQDEEFRFQEAIEAKAEFLVPKDKTTKLISCTSIILNPGFYAAEGATFQAFLEEDCPNDEQEITPDEELELNDEPVDFTMKNASTKQNATSSLRSYPNPFQTSTTIEYSLEEESEISLKVYDLSGRLIKAVVNGHQSQGVYKEHFDGADLTAGMYYVKLQTEQSSQTAKLMLVK